MVKAACYIFVKRELWFCCSGCECARSISMAGKRNRKM